MGLALRSFLLVLCIFLGGCAPVQPPFSHATSSPAEGQLFFADGSPATLSAVVARAASCDYILIGETHTIACDHIVQAKLIAGLAEAGLPFSVGMEMFSVDRQKTLDAVNSRTISLAEFPERADWSDAWGFSYSLYEPVIEALYVHQLPLFALNIPYELVEKIRDSGIDSLTPEERAYLPTVPIPPLAEQEEDLAKLHDEHVEMMAEDAENPKATKVAKKSLAQYRKHFFLIQSLWDTKMAEEAVRIRKNTGLPVVILAGGGHVEHGWGIAHRLAQLDAGAKTVLIMPWRNRNPIEYDVADIRFYCPLVKESRLGFTLRMEDGGTTITAVEKDSAADKAGFVVGDTIIKAGGMDVESLMTLHRAGVKAAKAKQDILFTIRRAGVERELSMPVPERPHKK